MSKNWKTLAVDRINEVLEVNAKSPYFPDFSSDPDSGILLELEIPEGASVIIDNGRITIVRLPVKD